MVPLVAAPREARISVRNVEKVREAPVAQPTEWEVAAAIPELENALSDLRTKDKLKIVLPLRDALRSISEGSADTDISAASMKVNSFIKTLNVELEPEAQAALRNTIGKLMTLESRTQEVRERLDGIESSLSERFASKEHRTQTTQAMRDLFKSAAKDAVLDKFSAEKFETQYRDLLSDHGLKSPNKAEPEIPVPQAAVVDLTVHKEISAPPAPKVEMPQVKVEPAPEPKPERPSLWNRMKSTAQKAASAAINGLKLVGGAIADKLESALSRMEMPTVKVADEFAGVPLGSEFKEESSPPAPVAQVATPVVTEPTLSEDLIFLRAVDKEMLKDPIRRLPGVSNSTKGAIISCLEEGSNAARAGDLAELMKVSSVFNSMAVQLDGGNTQPVANLLRQMANRDQYQLDFIAGGNVHVEFVNPHWVLYRIFQMTNAGELPKEPESK